MGIDLTTYYVSPLRYPGGKGKLTPYFKMMMEYNLISGGHYVELYAGGASVAISLLFGEFADEIHINDYDYRVFSFWHSVLNDCDRLVEMIESTEISIDVWKQQKKVQKSPDKFSQLEVGFSTFFLNRTNRSGILKAGVIGGKNQNGKWKIDARFNKENLVKRIKKINSYSERINLYNEDAEILIPKLRKKLPSNTLFYFDPPYYVKGKDLYINFYKHDDHLKIAKEISKIKKQKWVVSYDSDPNIILMYDDYLQHIYDLNYHANSAKVGTEVMIFSDNLIVPNIYNPGDKSELKEFNKDGLFADWIEKR